jgi:hypothetical protein
MQGRYSIEIDADEIDRTTTRDQWHALIATCKSLARDGLQYRLELAPVAGSDRLYTATVTAWGTPVKHKARKAAIPKVAIPDNPLTPEQCTRGRHKAEESVQHARGILRNHLTRFSKSYEYYFGDRYGSAWWRVYDQEKRERQRKFGRGLARIMSMRSGRDCDVRPVNKYYPLKLDIYAELDKLVGGRIMRVSELRTNEAEKGYWHTIIGRYADGHYGTKPEPFKHSEPQGAALLAELETAKADVEFWRELELLSGQREKFKPGKGSEVDKADDEVCTRNNVYVYV